MALKTQTRWYSFDQSLRERNRCLSIDMMNKNCIIFPDRVVSTVLPLLCETSCPPQQQEQGLPAASARTRYHRREATVTLLVVLQSGAAVAVVWAHARTQELCF